MLLFFAMFGSIVPAHAVPAVRHGLLARSRPACALLPWRSTMLVVAPLSARLVERFGTKLVVGSGLTHRGASALAARSRRCPPTNISYSGDVLPGA